MEKRNKTSDFYQYFCICSTRIEWNGFHHDNADPIINTDEISNVRVESGRHENFADYTLTGLVSKPSGSINSLYDLLIIFYLCSCFAGSKFGPVVKTGGHKAY